MHDAASIESINCEQLVTATDRWLVRAGRGAGRRPSPATFALPPSLARGSHMDIERTERTVAIRTARKLHAPSIALGVAIPSLFCIACGLVALL